MYRGCASWPPIIGQEQGGLQPFGLSFTFEDVDAGMEDKQYITENPDIQHLDQTNDTLYLSKQSITSYSVHRWAA